MPAKKKTTARKKKAAPRPAVSPWARFAKPIALVLGLAAFATWVWHMEGLAGRMRVEQGLENHPSTAAWYREQIDLVTATAEGTGQARALWFGEVSRTVHSRPRSPGASPQLVAVELTKAELLGGTAGRKDAGELVYISVYGFQFPMAPPTEGELWVFSVHRNADANSIVHSASPYFGG